MESGAERESLTRRQGRDHGRRSLEGDRPFATDRPEQEPPRATGAPETLVFDGNPAILALVTLRVALPRVEANPGSTA